MTRGMSRQPALRRIRGVNKVRWGGERIAWDFGQLERWRIDVPSVGSELCPGDIEHDTCTVWWLCTPCGAGR